MNAINSDYRQLYSQHRIRSSCPHEFIHLPTSALTNCAMHAWVYNPSASATRHLGAARSAHQSVSIWPLCLEEDGLEALPFKQFLVLLRIPVERLELLHTVAHHLDKSDRRAW